MTPSHFPAETASDLKITKASLTPFSIRFKGGITYQSSVAAMQSIDHRILSLTLKDGSKIHGEVARYPLYNTAETEAEEDATILQLRSASVGDIPEILRAWRLGGPQLRGLMFALDCAWHGLIAQRSGVPVSSLLGGPAFGVVPEVLSLSAGTKNALIAQIVADRGTAKVIQIKLGVGSLADELDTVRDILRVLNEDQLLLADFNGALAQEIAVKALPMIADPKLLWEEPCKDLDSNLAVAAALNGRMIFDTCLTDLTAYSRIIAASARYAVVKPALLGGLAVARVARDLCVANGVKLRVDGPWSGQTAATAALSLAIGVPPDQMIGSIDLTQALETDNDQIVKPTAGWVGVDQMRQSS